MSDSPKSPGRAPDYIGASPHNDVPPYLGAVPSKKAKPKDPRWEEAHQEGFNLGYAEGAREALKLINRILDRTELTPLGEGWVRSMGPADSQDLFKEVEAKIRKLQGR